MAPVVLVWAASTAMLGLSRHVYVLATNRQIPSWLGKLSRRRTPYVAIVLATVIAVGLVIPGDIEVLAGIYAFGATLAMAIAHAAILRLRAKKPDVERPFRVPFDVNVGGTAAAVAGDRRLRDHRPWRGSACSSTTTRRGGSAAAGWLFGLVGYVIYRKGFEGTTLTKRVEVPAQALEKQTVDVESEDILVPIFGTHLDDDIVGHGRAAGGGGREGGRACRRGFASSSWSSCR